MSLFIGALAFPRSPLLLAETQLGMFSGSLLSALAGVTWLGMRAAPLSRRAGVAAPLSR